MSRKNKHKISNRIASGEDGFAALQLDLQKIGKDVPRAIVEKALPKGAAIVVEGVRSRIIPRGKSTGTLRRGIAYGEPSGGIGEDNRIYIGWAGIKRGSTTRSQTNVYGPILEYSETRVLRHMAVGFEDTREAAMDAIKKEIDDAMRT